MDKLDLTSPDLTARNIDAIYELFPSVVTETRDDDGTVRRAVDFDLLRQELSDHVVEGPQERYGLTWPGKRRALLAANAPIRKTLRPVREESVDFDTTKNIFIEGDNLEALKLLQESYLGKVKLIYIDPPYNTGNDFIYNDDFAETTAEYLARSGQVDDSGARLRANPETNGRFHSDWLSMMYPRLKLARNLLREDGLLFISIDHGEVSNLDRMCSEIFGQSNFICFMLWRRKREISNDAKNVAIQGEYIAVYGRSENAILNSEPLSDAYIETAYRAATIEFPDGRWRGVPITVSKGLRGGGYEYTLESPTGHRTHRTWAYPRASFQKLVDQGRVYWGMDGESIPQRVVYAHESGGQPVGNYWDKTATNKQGKNEVLEHFGDAVFDTAKPTALLKRVLKISTARGAVVLDFFAGSGTFAEAVMKVNAEDAGYRTCISIQVPEILPTTSTAGKSGYSNVAEVAMERMRRAGRSISASSRGNPAGDVGFRLLRVESSNMVDVLRTPGKTSQGQLDMLTDSVKPDRTGEDLLFQVLLDWGLELSVPIARDTIDNREVFVVDDGALIACFAENVSPAVVAEIARRQPLRAVFRDSGFDTDAQRINAEQVFTQVSPATDVKTI